MLLIATQHGTDRHAAWDYWFHAGKRKVSNAEIRRTKCQNRDNEIPKSGKQNCRNRENKMPKQPDQQS